VRGNDAAERAADQVARRRGEGPQDEDHAQPGQLVVGQRDGRLVEQAEDLLERVGVDRRA
jgi:hypothetical protein